MRRLSGQSGFTLVELLVTVGLFSTMSVGMYSVLFSTRDGSQTAQQVATVSQEARLGFNRMVRDTREAGLLVSATPTSFTIKIDFDGDQAYTGDFEETTYAYDAAGDRITISNDDVAPTVSETLIGGVVPVDATTDIFSFGSNLLEHDSNEDGVTNTDELDAARDAGASLLTDNLLYITNITFSFIVGDGDSESVFYTQAQLRNARGSL